MKKQKKSYVFYFILMFSNIIFSQAPQKMSYQAVVRNASNQLVANQIIGMQVSILQGSVNGPIVYQEIITPSPTTNVNGLVSTEIGSSNPLNSISWSNGPFYLKTEIDPTGGSNFTITGTTQLLSVPYALYAETAGSVLGSPNHYIGEQYGGGIIFHLWYENGTEHGLIISNNDIANNEAWSNVNNTSVGGTAQSSFNGLVNTNAIIAQTNHTSSAALTCLNYTGGGYNDWYLPSIDELNLLWNNRFNVNKTLSIVGSIIPNNLFVGFLNGPFYWSSTEVSGSASSAFALDFRLGTVSSQFKNGPSTGSSTYLTRAVRSF